MTEEQPALMRLFCAEKGFFGVGQCEQRILTVKRLLTV